MISGMIQAFGEIWWVFVTVTVIVLVVNLKLKDEEKK